MTTAPLGPPVSPVPPKLRRAKVDALIEYATAMSEYSQWWVDFTRSQGEVPNAQAIHNVEGWAFVAEALFESYD